MTSVQKLKLLTTCSISNSEKLKIWEKHYKAAPDNVLKYLQVNESDYKAEAKRDSSKESDANNDVVDDVNVESKEVTKPSPSIMSQCQLVMSSRTKSLEELPAIKNKSEKDDIEDEGSKLTAKAKPRSKKLFSSSDKTKTNKGKSKSKDKSEDDITEFIKDGEILYSKLLKHEINKFDKSLLEAAKKTNNIGGKILINDAVLGNDEMTITRNNINHGSPRQWSTVCC